MHRSCCIQRKRRSAGRRDKTCQTDELHNSRDTRNLFACLRMLRSCMSARMREKKREREREGDEREREKKESCAPLLYCMSLRGGQEYQTKKLKYSGEAKAGAILQNENLLLSSFTALAFWPGSVDCFLTVLRTFCPWMGPQGGPRPSPSFSTQHRCCRCRRRGGAGAGGHKNGRNRRLRPRQPLF